MKRPLGISLLAILYGLIGVGWIIHILLTSLWIMQQSPYLQAPTYTWLWNPLWLLATPFFFLAWGLWKMQSWAYWLQILVTLVGIFLAILIAAIPMFGITFSLIAIPFNLIALAYVYTVRRHLGIGVDKKLIEGIAESDIIYCNNCGAENPPSTEFCVKCGRKIFI